MMAATTLKKKAAPSLLHATVEILHLCHVKNLLSSNVSNMYIVINTRSKLKDAIGCSEISSCHFSLVNP